MNANKEHSFRLYQNLNIWYMYPSQLPVSRALFCCISNNKYLSLFITIFPSIVILPD